MLGSIPLQRKYGLAYKFLVCCNGIPSGKPNWSDTTSMFQNYRTITLPMEDPLRFCEDYQLGLENLNITTIPTLESAKVNRTRLLKLKYRNQNQVLTYARTQGSVSKLHNWYPCILDFKIFEAPDALYCVRGPFQQVYLSPNSGSFSFLKIQCSIVYFAENSKV